MGLTKWKVEFYEKPNGRCPTIDILNGLSQEEKVAIKRYLGRLEEHGPDLPRPTSGYLRNHIHELRPPNHRILYFFYERKKFIVTHIIPKQSNKVPDNEIDRAIRYRNDYYERHKE